MRRHCTKCLEGEAKWSPIEDLRAELCDDCVITAITGLGE